MIGSTNSINSSTIGGGMEYMKIITIESDDLYESPGSPSFGGTSSGCKLNMSDFTKKGWYILQLVGDEDHPYIWKIISLPVYFDGTNVAGDCVVTFYGNQIRAIIINNRVYMTNADYIISTYPVSN